MPDKLTWEANLCSILIFSSNCEFWQKNDFGNDSLWDSLHTLYRL